MPRRHEDPSENAPNVWLTASSRELDETLKEAAAEATLSEPETRPAAGGSGWDAVFLARVARELARPTDAIEKAEAMARLSVRDFADLCVVYRTLGPDSIALDCFAHRDPECEALLRQSLEFPPLTGSGADLKSALRAATILSDAELPRAGAHTFADHPQLNSLVGRLAITTGLLVPLRVRESLTGLIGFYRAGPAATVFGEADLPRVEALAQILALALESARLHEEIEQVKAAREDFLSVVAHDLRSPLGAISVSAEMLIEFNISEEARRYHLEIVQNAGARMSRVIQDLVDYNKLESGKLTLEILPHPLKPIVEEACALFVTRAQIKGARLEWGVDEGVGEVPVDRYRLLQVLGALLENAVKSVRAGGRISVEAGTHADSVLISIAEDGARVPLEELSQVFDRYWPPRRAGGASIGIGLEVAKMLITGHGGTIWATSAAGEGNHYVFTLPLPDSRRGGNGAAGAPGP